MTGAGIEDEIDGAGGESCAGAVGYPGIFADFKADADAANVEDEIADGGGVVGEMMEIGDADGPGLEPTGFIVDAIASEVLFGDEASDFPVHDDSNGVVERVLMAYRQADGDDHASGVGQEIC